MYDLSEFGYSKKKTFVITIIIIAIVAFAYLAFFGGETNVEKELTKDKVEEPIIPIIEEEKEEELVFYNPLEIKEK